MSEGMLVKEKVLKFVENEFGGCVLVTFYFFGNDFDFLVYFVLGKCAVEHNVEQQLDGSGEVFTHEGCIDEGFLFRGVGVQVAAYSFHSIENVPGASVLCTLEEHVFTEVRHAVFMGFFITCTGIDGNAAISHVGGTWHVDEAQTVGKGVGRELLCHLQ